MNYLMCPQCQNKFATKDKRAKYCSRSCSNRSRAHLALKAKQSNPISASNDQRPVEVIPSDGSPTYIQFTLNGKEYAESGKRWAAGSKDKDVVTLAGNGCSLQVDKGQLLLRSGFGCSTVTDREKRISRGVHAVRAIIVLNTTGHLSTAAIQWCADQRIALYVIDRDANLTALTHPSIPNAISLRRLQFSVDSLALAKEILFRKFDACIKSKPILTQSFIQSADSIMHANTLEELRLIEARAAIIYGLRGIIASSNGKKKMCPWSGEALLNELPVFLGKDIKPLIQSMLF